VVSRGWIIKLLDVGGGLAGVAYKNHCCGEHLTSYCPRHRSNGTSAVLHTNHRCKLEIEGPLECTVSDGTLSIILLKLTRIGTLSSIEHMYRSSISGWNTNTDMLLSS
jgi:hypothetical protein